MAERTLKNFINGDYVDATADSAFDVIDPAARSTAIGLFNLSSGLLLLTVHLLDGGKVSHLDLFGGI